MILSIDCQTLSNDIKQQSIKTQNHIFFFSGHQPQSNFHIKKFKIDGEVYVCPEQYIQSQKDKLAKCYNVVKQVLETNVTAEMVRLCKDVPRLNPTIWETEAPEMVRRCLQAKFQDLELRKSLLETGSKTIVKASPHDRKCGIGYPIHYRNIVQKRMNGVKI